MDKIKKAVIVSSSGVTRPAGTAATAVKESADLPPDKGKIGAADSAPAAQIQSGADTRDGGKKPPKGKYGFLDALAGRIKKVKHFEFILVGVFALAAVLIFFNWGGSFGSGDKTDADDNQYISASDYCLQTESKLGRILSTVKGAGSVEVMINFESTPERILAYIVTVNANKSASGDTNFNETDNKTQSPQILNVNGQQVPLVLKELAPKVTGVIVVSEGADNIKTRLDLINATAVLLDIDRENIIVLTMNKAR